MLNKFVKAQYSHPAPRNEWTEQVKLDLAEFEIWEDLNWIKGKSEFSFKKLVKTRAHELALEMNPRKGKMRNLFYTELKIQEYLKDDRITNS